MTTIRSWQGWLSLLTALILSIAWTTLAACSRRPNAPEQGAQAQPLGPKVSRMTFKKPSKDELLQRLSPLEYEVTQRNATEPPFRNAFWDHHEEGLYVDIASGEPLFSSRDKFDSGTGWPSFTRPVETERVITRVDRHLGMERTEVRSQVGDSHLGHVFDDGPAPANLRYCINSASLRFIPATKLETEGYGAYASLFGAKGTAKSEKVSGAAANTCATPQQGNAPGCETTLETAIVAGGCFWGMQDLLRKIPGVLATEVGYSGGKSQEPSYEDVRQGTTGHAEAVRIVFDPTKLSYEDLLEKWFFRMHDPTTADRQGNDVGSQYRSAIFYTSASQRQAAEAVKLRVGKSEKWKAPIVTQIVEAGPFTLAEGYHQDYLQKNPGGYSCHYLRD